MPADGVQGVDGFRGICPRVPAKGACEVPHLGLEWQPAALMAACLALTALACGRLRRRRLAFAAQFAREAALLLGLYALWQFAGSFSVMSSSGALPRGQRLWHVERVLHLPDEAAVQRLFVSHPLVVQAFNLYYAVLHFPVLIACLIWLFAWHRDDYGRIRSTIVVFTGASLLIQFIPVAPPRLLPGTGLVDTAAEYGQSVYAWSTGFNADQYSAMPSVHVGWALIVAMAVITVSRSRWRWAAAAYPALTLLVVVATANHFWLDGVVAAILLVAALEAQRAGRALRISSLMFPTAALPGTSSPDQGNPDQSRDGEILGR